MEGRALRLGAVVFVVSASVAGAMAWYAWQASSGIVGALAALQILLTIGLTWLVYTLAASRHRLAAQADAAAERRGQEALQQIAQQYQRVVEEVEQVIFQLDLEGRLTFLSRPGTP